MLDQSRIDKILDRIGPIPIVQTLRMRFDQFDEGFCKLTVPYDRQFDGVFESFHGGMLMTVADSVACFAIMTRTGPDEVLTTTDMNIRFLSACLSDVTAEARVIKLGRTLCPVAVDLFDADGKHIAIAQVTYMRLDKMPRRG